MLDNEGAAASDATNDSPSSGEDAATDFFREHVSAAPAGKTRRAEQGRSQQRPAARQPLDDDEGEESADLDGLDDVEEADLDEESLDDEDDAQDEPNEDEDEGAEDEELDEPDADNAAEEGGDAQLHRIIVDGKPHHVTYAEMRDLASQGLNFTQKAQVTAEEKRATIAEREQTKAERQALINARGDYARKLVELGDAMDQALGNTVDWEALRAEDPEGFLQQFAEHQIRKESRQKVTAEQERIRGEQMADLDKQRNLLLQSEKEKMLDKIPEWRDEKVRRRDFRAIANVALSVGYTQDDLSQVTDSRLMLLLRKAARMDALEKKLPPKAGTKGKTQASVKESTENRRGETRLTQLPPRNEKGEFLPPRRKAISPVLRPNGMRPVATKTSRLRERLATTHAEEDAVPLFSQYLADEAKRRRR